MTINELSIVAALYLDVRWIEGLLLFHASFQKVETMENGILGSVFGEGETREDAIADYCKRIAGKRIAVNAHKEKRREYQIPRTLTA